MKRTSALNDWGQIREAMGDRKLNGRNFILAGVVLAGAYGVMNAAAKKRTEPENIDAGNPYIKPGEAEKRPETVYEGKVKPVVDKLLSFGGLVVFSPLYGLLSLAVYLDDPGPVFFTQKRVGKDKHFFMLHKYRSMKMDTPHDVPTHQLSDPEQYITRVGRVLRKSSLDELPQIWDIFRGRMSIIGPRPALWNQEDLVKERDKYSANSVTPGLTGWAQINGRDELEIPEKAKLDGEYVRQLRQGGRKALFFDVKCLFGTVLSVAGGDGVVEGGTGEIHKRKVSRRNGVRSKKTEADHRTAYRMEAVEAADAGFEDYAYKKKFEIDTNAAHSKRVLITGANSYIGQSFETYAREHYSENFIIDTVDMIDGTWREKDFGDYDCVFHVAGIAHADVGHVDEETKAGYYAVNTDLAVETARKAKAEGVSQFVFMSSMIIYGEAAPIGKQKVIDEHTLPAPANFYGDSKWQADKLVRRLQDKEFHVAVLRPPMIYGRGSKGNYKMLAKLAKKLPVFPDINHRRSMLHIDILCEFLSLLMISGEGGIYFPQNREYSSTASLVREINHAVGKRIWMTKYFNPAVRVLAHFPGKIGRLTDKAFGDCVYSQKLSIYNGLEYRLFDLKESVKRTEGHNTYDQDADMERKCQIPKKPHILVISQYFYPETFRINDMASEWVKRGYKVTVLTGIPNYPMGKFFEGYGYRSRRKERWNGMEIIRIPLIPRGNSSVGMVANYLSFAVSGFIWKAMTDIRADLVFTFEVSPMTQALIGCWYKKKYHVPHYLYVTDLWPENVESVTGIHSKAVIYPIQKMVDYVYKNCDRIFTCSQSFIEPISQRGISKARIEFWPQYAEDFYRPVKKEDSLEKPKDEVLNLVFAGSVGYAQGLGILVEAAKILKSENRRVCFHIIGDGRYLPKLQESIKANNLEDSFNLIPRKPAEEIPKYLAWADALLITLSKSDVFSITIPAKTQSCMACGKPILVSADGEVQEIIQEADAGLCSDAEDVCGFVDNIKSFMELSTDRRNELASNALHYSEIHFNKERLLGRLDEIFKIGA